MNSESFPGHQWAKNRRCHLSWHPSPWAHLYFTLCRWWQFAAGYNSLYLLSVSPRFLLSAHGLLLGCHLGTGVGSASTSAWGSEVWGERHQGAGDSLLPMKGRGRCVNASAALPSGGWFWVTLQVPQVSRISLHCPSADLDYLCLCQFLFQLHLTLLPPQPWSLGSLLKWTTCTQVLVSGCLTEHFVQSTFILHPMVNVWVPSGKFTGPGHGNQLGIWLAFSAGLGLGPRSGT